MMKVMKVLILPFIYNTIETNKISETYDESDESFYNTDNTIEANKITDSYDESENKVNNNIAEDDRVEIIYTSTLEQKKQY